MKTEKEIENLIDQLEKDIDKIENNNFMKPGTKMSLVHDRMNDIAVLR